MKHDKLRDMVRSILPSTRRQRAREEKAIARRSARRVARHELRIADFETADLDRDADQAGNVSQRRSADKLNHFMRWADALTEGMSAYEALQHIRAILPKNLIGDHAYSHWEQHIKARERRVYPSGEAIRQSWIDRWRFKLRRALSEDPMLHGELNAEIKSRRMFDEDRRLLAGMHDVDAFVEDVAPFGRTYANFKPERSVMIRRVGEHEKGGAKPPFAFSDLLRPLAAAA
jgi:hypothetical protein